MCDGGPGYVLGDSGREVLGVPMWRGLGGPRCGGARVWAVQIWEGTAKGWAPVPTYSTLSNPWSMELVIYALPSTLPSHQTLNRCSIHWPELFKEIISLSVIT